jgi:adenylate cyclase
MEPANPDALHADPEEEFDAVLARFSASRDVAERARIDDEIWQRFGTEGAVFISDMSGFSRTTRALGICHFLAQIYRVRPVVARAVGENGGILLKAETDNCYAFFPEVDQAVTAAMEINRELDRQNLNRDTSDKSFVSIGIDWGRMLLIGEVEFFGDPINTASKLGEDLAARSEILVTRRAMDRVTIELDREPDVRRERISGIDIDFLCLDMAIHNG